MISPERIKEMEKQGYRFVGNHSAIKTCLWCKKAVRGEDTCYKNTFYNIKSWRCIEAAVSVDICNLRCQWCWRDIAYSGTVYEKIDDPKAIVEGFIREHKELLMGFWGNFNVDKKRLYEAMEPKHVAISLTGEACLYPKLPELVEEIGRRGMTSFLVTNGTVPSMVRKLIGTPLTQLYITLPAPDKETYQKMCDPLLENGWEKIMESLQLLQYFKRSVIRLTVGKEMNMHAPEKYAEIIKNVKFDWLEVKAAMPIGFAQYRMTGDNFATHQEIMDFSQKIADLCGMKIIDQKENSRVALVSRQDSPDRKLSFDWDKPEYEEFIKNLPETGCGTGGVHLEKPAEQLIPVSVLG